MSMSTIDITKAPNVVGILRLAHDLIETGEPWSSPQGYAVAARNDCLDMIEDVEAGKIDDYRWVGGVVFTASTMTATEDEEELVAAQAQAIVDAIDAGLLPGTGSRN